MRFPQSARSRGPNPEPASLIAPVVSSSACCSRELNPKRGDEPYAFRARALFNRERFSTAHAPRTRETLSRLSNQPRPLTVERVRRRGFFRFVSSRRELVRSLGPRKRLEVRSRRARRARASTHADARDDGPPRRDVSLETFSASTSRRHVRRRTVRARVLPSSPRPREDRGEALGSDEARGRARHARVPSGHRGGLRRRAVAQRAGRDVLPLRLRGGAAVRVRAASASRRARAPRTVVASDTSVFVRSADALLFEKKTRNANASLPARPARAPSWAWARSAASPRSGTPPASASGGRRGSSRAASAASARSAAPCTAAKFDAACARRETKRRTRETRRTRTTNDERGVRIRPASV